MKTRHRWRNCIYGMVLPMICILLCVFAKNVLSEKNNLSALAAGKKALFIVSDPQGLYISEEQILVRLTANLGFTVTVGNENSVKKYNDADFDIVIVSKSVTSTNVGSYFKQCPCGFLTWEDNLQQLQMMALISNDGSTGTAWHSTGTSVYVLPEADKSLTAGVSGETVFLSQPGEITWGPNGQLAADAHVVAQLPASNGTSPYYVYEKGTIIADGTTAAGRRAYFGLYDDTYRYLTADGKKLFDAAVLWTSGVKLHQ